MSRKSYSLKYPILILIPVILVIPAVVLGANFTLAGNTFKSLIENYILGILNLLTPILFAGAFLVFFWGLSKFILNSSSKEDIEKGKRYMIWSILALFILISFRTIIILISSELELGSGTEVPLLRGGEALTPSVSTGETFELGDGTTLAP